MGTLTKRIGPLPLWSWSVATLGALVVAYIVYKHSKSITTTPTAATAASGVAGTSVVGDPGVGGLSGYSAGQGSSLYGSDSTFTSVLQQLEQQLQAQNPQPSTTPVTTGPTPMGGLSGSGLMPGPSQIVTTPDGTSYHYIGTPDQVKALGGYGNTFFFPFEGDPQPWNASLAPGTPVWAKLPFQAQPTVLPTSSAPAPVTRAA